MIRSRVATILLCGLSLAAGEALGQKSASASLRRADPAFTVEIDNVREAAGRGVAAESGDSTIYRLAGGIVASLREESPVDGAWRARVTFRNASPEKRRISNVVPLGALSDRVHITAIGPPSLSRSALFRPGHGPVGVILPDNAWEMGFCDLPVTDSASVSAVARRIGWTNAEPRRFQTILEPGGSVEYRFIAEIHPGGWREGLRLAFRERWLYDLRTFDDSLFRRDDLAWIRKSAVLTLFFAWDREYFDPGRGGDRFEQLLEAQARTFGGYDAFILWPTWPRLGIDERNQWDLYRDLPGGVARLRRQSEIAHRRGTKYFIAYNPWDESTRTEEHLRGMEEILRATDADGVVLDTRGESSRELQAAADRVRPGIIMYSEGMAVPKDMPGIVAGRVHDALVIPPPLNLNKLIKPEFAIFRVLQVADARLHREILLSLFNGYGVELNVMRAGRPETVGDEFLLLGRAARILRENPTAFLSRSWMPLHPSLAESVWVNEWPAGPKTLYTVYGSTPRGHEGPLIPIQKKPGVHYVSLWRHEEAAGDSLGGRWVVSGAVDPFPRSRLGTREEGSLDVIAEFPSLLTVRIAGDSLFVDSPERGEVRVWRGNPSYDRKPATFRGGPFSCALSARFGAEEGKVVVQLFEEGEILDERIAVIAPATPRLAGGEGRTSGAANAPAGMVECPAGSFRYAATLADDANPVIPYPDLSAPRELRMRRFFIDEFPVTNNAFAKFLAASRYAPRDTAGFLRHWAGHQPPAGKGDHPVVWVSPEDARAYARWAGKRLPTAAEWQYAAQGVDGRSFPWGNALDTIRCNAGLNRTTAVTAFPGGKSPFGMQDCVGNVWQLTADEYFNGAYRYVIMKGGSYYDPVSSIWYVKGGPARVDRQQMLLRGGGALDRNATIGFRCVKDAR